MSVSFVRRWLVALACGLVLALLAPATSASASSLTSAAVPAATARTSVYFEGEPGDWLVGGSSRSYSSISSVGTRGSGILTFNLGWQIWFAVPAGSQWATGTYENAERADFRSPGHPGIEMFGEGRGCNNLTGRFIVDEVTLDADGTPLTFSARFEAHCEGGDPGVFGQLSYNASAPLVAHTIPFASAFGSQDVGTASAPRAVTVTNSGQDPLHLGSVALTGSDAGSFGIAFDGCAGVTLAVSASCTLEVVFAPIAAGARSAKLTIFDDLAPPGGTGRDVALSGTGLAVGDPFGEYTAVTPARVLDTRNGTGQGGIPGPIPGGGTRSVQILGRGGIPASGVEAVVLNVTVVAPDSWGWARIWPSGVSEPTVSNLNYVAGQTVANQVTVPVGADGKVVIRVANAATDVLFDVVGSYADSSGRGGSRFHGINPVRFLDTRVPGTPVGPGGTLAMKVTGAGGVPSSGVKAVALNLTVTQPTSWGWVTAYPGDVAQPTASTVNFYGGQTVSNTVIVRVPDDGVIRFGNALGTTHLIADVVGYYDQDRSTQAGRFVAVNPSRTFDSRVGQGALAPDDGVVITWLDGSSQPIPWLGSVVTNVTATQPTSSGWITAFPADATSIPWVSSLNFIAGATVPNQVMVRTSQQQAGPFAVGSVAFYNPYGYTHLIVDLFGFFTNSSAPAPTPAAVANGIQAVTPSPELHASASPLR